jgi:hypothetical protein
VNSFRDLPNSAIIQIQGASGARQCIPCGFDRMDGKRLTLTAADCVNVCTAVTVEYNDAMFLGEVLGCGENADGSWRVEIKVEQILTGLQSLINLRARLLGEGVPDFTRAAVRR